MACSTRPSILYTCLGFVLLASGFKFVQSFKVTRSWADSFSNPDCDATSCPRICERYDARCSSLEDDCSNCECAKGGEMGEFKRTYVGDGKGQGKCLEPGKIVKASVPKASMVISSPDKHPPSRYQHAPLLECFRVKSVLIMDECYNGDISMLWIYTKNRQFLNLKRLECLDVEDPINVKTAPCKLDNEYQKWECAKSSDPKYPDRLYQRKGKNNTFLDYYAYDVHKPRLLDAEKKCKQCKWGAYSESSPTPARSLCATPLEYKGCYRFNDGKEMRDLYVYFDEESCETNCFKSFRVLAPIFVENTNCVVAWQRSSFLANNQPLKTLSTFNNEGDFSVSNALNDTRGVNLKVSYRAYKRWAGTVMKLQVQCSSTDSSTSEEHCVLLKFHGKYAKYTDNKTNVVRDCGQVKNKVLMDAPSSKKASSHDDDDDNSLENRYKASTIALSVIVALLCLVMAVGIFMVLRRRGKRTQLASYDSGNDPICGRDEHTQI